MRALAVAAVFLCAPASAHGQTEGDYLYNVTMLRAAPGHFTELKSVLEESLAVHEMAGIDLRSGSAILRETSGISC